MLHAHDGIRQMALAWDPDETKTGAGPIGQRRCMHHCPKPELAEVDVTFPAAA